MSAGEPGPQWKVREWAMVKSGEMHARIEAEWRADTEEFARRIAARSFARRCFLWHRDARTVYVGKKLEHACFRCGEIIYRGGFDGIFGM